jgi:hypothetical protein
MLRIFFAMSTLFQMVTVPIVNNIVKQSIVNKLKKEPVDPSGVKDYDENEP